MKRKIRLSPKEAVIIKGRVDEGTHFTWKQLLEQLKKLTPEQLAQNVQIFPPHCTPDPIKLMPVYGVYTVAELCHDGDEVLDETRSADDFKHHPEQVVLMSDHCPFSDDGDTYFTMNEDGTMTGNVSGKTTDFLGRSKRKKNENR